MRILYIGAGFVGACSAAAMADSGHSVLVYDIDKQKISALMSANRDQIDRYIFEKGLADLIKRNQNRIKFTFDYSDVVRFLDRCDAVFMCLPTPEKKGGSGETDLSFYKKAASQLASYMICRNGGGQKKHIVVINKSTLPIDMVKQTWTIFNKKGVKNFGIAANPEFLVEGSAIEGSMKPDRIVVGAWSGKDFLIMRKIYQRFYDSPGVKYIEVNPYEAAAGKLLANFMLFSRLTATFDVVGRLCEAFPDMRFENIRQILASDERIGKWGFYNSLYAGGSCLIKDAASLAHQLERAGVSVKTVKNAIDVNEFQRDNFFDRAEKEAKIVWEGKSAAVIGVAFKRNTNDVRNSPALKLIERLVERKVKEIRIFDPAANESFYRVLKATGGLQLIRFFDSEKEALQNTRACFILTDWPQFRTLGEIIKYTCGSPYLIMDGRRILRDSFLELQELGFDIIAVGSPYMKGKKKQKVKGKG